MRFGKQQPKKTHAHTAGCERHSLRRSLSCRGFAESAPLPVQQFSTPFCGKQWDLQCNYNKRRVSHLHDIAPSARQARNEPATNKHLLTCAHRCRITINVGLCIHGVKIGLRGRWLQPTQHLEATYFRGCVWPCLTSLEVKGCSCRCLSAWPLDVSRVKMHVSAFRFTAWFRHESNTHSKTFCTQANPRTGHKAIDGAQLASMIQARKCVLYKQLAPCILQS